MREENIAESYLFISEPSRHPDSVPRSEFTCVLRLGAFHLISSAQSSSLLLGGTKGAMGFQRDCSLIQVHL